MVDKQESFESEYYSFINELWSILLKIQFTGNQKKRIRRDHVNHFCFTLNKTYIFNTRKICNDNGLILLIQLICSLLKLSWVRYIFVNINLYHYRFRENKLWWFRHVTRKY